MRNPLRSVWIPVLTSLTMLVATFAVVASEADAAAVPLEASFTVSPERPAPGEPVVLTSTTTPAAQSGRTYTWDLDADGAFDDASGESVTTSFAAAGSYVVRLRAQQSGLSVQSDDAERTIEVVAAPSEPQQEQAPPSPPPPPPPSGNNKAPDAGFDLGCTMKGGMLFCAGLFSRHQVPHTFDASPSSDPDGQIVRYEWDLGADGSYEHDTGATPTLTRTFLHTPGQANKRTMRVRVTDDKGATDTADMALTTHPPACIPEMSAGLLKARSTCLRPRTAGATTRYRSTYPVSVNGIVLRPGPGGVTIIVGPAGTRIKSPKAEVTVPVKQTYATLFSGKVDWRVSNGRLSGFALGAGAELNGLRVTGLDGLPRLQSGAASEVRMHVALPADFGGPTSSTPVVVRPNAAQAAGDDPLRFEVPAAAIGPIGMKSLVVTYDGDGLWEIEGTVAVPAPIPLEVTGGAGIHNGAFHHAKAGVEFPGGGLGPFGPVYIQRIAFEVMVKPKKTSKCVPKIGKEKFDLEAEFYKATGHTIDLGDARYAYLDHGHPTFALCGEIELTGGPQLFGAAAIRLNAGMGLRTFDDRPFILRAHGEISLIEIPLAKAWMEVHGDGYTSMRGEFHWEPIDGLLSLDGFLTFKMRAPKFNAEAYVRACLEFIDTCAGAHGLISTKGVAVCLHIEVLGLNWEPGVGYKWGDTFPDLYFSGCDVGPYREHIAPKKPVAKAAQAAGEKTAIDLPAGLPGAVIAATGRDAPPKITLIGPKGERIETPDAPKLERPGVFLFKEPRSRLTQVAIAKPSGGRWTIEVAADSSPVVSIKSAEGLEKPKVEATVSGRGQQRTLSFEIDERPGQKVTFVERGASAGTYVGDARGATGRLAFTPGAGKAERRTIVAIVEQDGMVRDEIEVASYRAPDAPRAGRVARLKVRRRGGGLAVSWARSADASEHEVRVVLSDGRRLLRRTRRTRIAIPAVARAVGGSVTVRGVRLDGRNGLPSRVRLPIG